MIMRARVLNAGNVMDVACDEQGRLSIGGVTLEGNVAIDLTSTNALLEDIRDTLNPASGNFVVQIDPAVAVRIDDSTPLDVNLESLAAIFNAGIPVRIDNVDSDIDFRVTIESLDSTAFPNGLNVNLNAINTTLFPNGIPVDLQGATDLTVTATIDQDPGDPPLRVTLEGTTPGSSLSVSLDDFNLPLPGLPVYLDATSSPLRVIFQSPQTVVVQGDVELDADQFTNLSVPLDEIRDILTANSYNVSGVSGQRVIIHDADGVLSNSNPLRTQSILLDSAGTPYDASNRVQVSSRLLDATNTAFGVSGNPIFTTGSLRDSTGALITNANPLPTSASVDFPSDTVNEINRSSNATLNTFVTSDSLVTVPYSRQENSNNWSPTLIGLTEVSSGAEIALHKSATALVPNFGAGNGECYRYITERSNSVGATYIPRTAMVAKVLPVSTYNAGVELLNDDQTYAGVQVMNMNTAGELLVGGRLKMLARSGAIALGGLANSENLGNITAKAYNFSNTTNGAIPLKFFTGFAILQVTKINWVASGGATSSSINFTLQFNNHPDPSSVDFEKYWFSASEYSNPINSFQPAAMYGSFAVANRGNYIKIPVLGRWCRPIFWFTGDTINQLSSTFDIMVLHSNT